MRTPGHGSSRTGSGTATARLLRVAAGVALALTAAAGACTPDDQRTETLDPQGSQTRAQLPEAVVARLDSGNAAFRDGDLEAAAGHYRAVTEEAPDLASGWFGLYMVAEQQGDDEAAEEYLERARGLAPGASIIHPQPGDTL